ncbi:tetratricopeptide repeat protein [Massilia sp. SR12]
MMRRALPWLLWTALFGAPVLAAAQANGAVAGAAAGAAGAAGADAAADSDFEPVRQEFLYRQALQAVAENRLEDAAALLERFIIDEPRHAGAFLELALAHCGLGNKEQALKLFATIEERFNPPPGIMEVIQHGRATGCERKAERPATWLVSVGRGRDNNVNQGTSNPYFTIGTGSNQGSGELDPEFLPQADSFSVLNASYVRPLTSKGTIGILQAYARRHDHLHEQDSTSLLTGIEHSMALGRWRVRATGAMGVATLDGRMYQRQHQAQLRASPPISLPENLDLAAAINVSHVAYPTRPTYDSNTVEASLVLTQRSKRDHLQFTMSRLHDHGKELRPGGDRNGWFANAQWYTALRSGLYADANLTHQYWRSDRLYSPKLIDIVRRQNTTTLRGALQWYFQPNLSLHLEGRVVHNRENISLFQYNSRALQLSLRWDNL